VILSRTHADSSSCSSKHRDKCSHISGEFACNIAHNDHGFLMRQLNFSLERISSYEGHSKTKWNSFSTGGQTSAAPPKIGQVEWTGWLGRTGKPQALHWCISRLKCPSFMQKCPSEIRSKMKYKVRLFKEPRSLTSVSQENSPLICEYLSLCIELREGLLA